MQFIVICHVFITQHAHKNHLITQVHRNQSHLIPITDNICALIDNLYFFESSFQN